MRDGPSSGGRLSVRKNAIYSSLANVLVAVSGFFFNLLIVRALDKDTFGTYVYLIALASVFVPILDAGLVGFYTVRSSRERASVSRFFCRSIIIKSAVATIVLPLFLLVYTLLEGGIDATAAWLLLYLVLQSILTGSDIIFISQEKNDLWTTRRLTFESARFVMFGVALYYFQVRDVPTLAALAAAATGVGVLGTGYLGRRFVSLSPGDFRAALEGLKWRRELLALLPFAAFQLLFILNFRIPVILLERLASAVEVADFQVCFLAMQVVLYSSKGLTQAVAPRLSLYQHEGDQSKLQGLLDKGIEVILFGSALVLAAGVLFGHDFLVLVFGSAYASTAQAWQIMAWVTAILFVQNYLAGLLNYLGGERAIAKHLAVSLGLQTILTIWLAPAYGAVGAVIGVLASSTMLVVLNYVSIGSLLSARVFRLRRLAQYIGIALVSGVLVWAGPQPHFLVSAVALVALYVGSCWLSGLIPVVIVDLAGSIGRRMHDD